jgi:hypothetical protein
MAGRDVVVTTLSLGAFNGATELPLAKFPAEFGGVTVIEAYILGPSAGTVIGGKLVTMSDAGTPAINGTIGTFAGTVVTAAGVPGALTLSSASAAYVTKDYWIGFDQTSGTVPAGTFISLSYVMGK